MLDDSLKMRPGMQGAIVREQLALAPLPPGLGFKPVLILDNILIPPALHVLLEIRSILGHELLVVPRAA